MLVLTSRKPDKTELLAFLRWAWSHHRAVYFLGGVRTDVLSRDIAVESVESELFLLPEYDSPTNAYPDGVRLKEFDFGIYKFVPRAPALPRLDVGNGDGLYVKDFHAVERDARGTYRWTRAESYLLLVGVPADANQLVLWMDNGGRPASAPPAQIEVFGRRRLARQCGRRTRDTTLLFPIPPDIARTAESSADAMTIRLNTITWNPAALLKVIDDRDLGVMVDRVEIRRAP